jgi:mRNA-degrading endonuclease RelE of RelBE toxin-antitoxin system
VSDNELQKFIDVGIEEVNAGTIGYRSPKETRETLSKRWEIPPDAYGPTILYHRGLDDLIRGPVAREPQPAPPPWLLGVSSTFHEHTDRIDRKLRGRLLEAILELSASKLEIHGDTIKPLSGEYKGCWRYRIGDYRLIFLPNQLASTLTLLAFLPRGEAYE